LRELTLSTASLFLAAGLDPDRATVFVQSDVPAHVELSYLLESTAHVGELRRMIQFKEKGRRPGTRASLFTYPCLMAADILLYDAQQVPVGGDQSQHVELARDLAEPSRKMSKSAPPGATGVIRLLDPPDVVRRKIRRARTDGDGELRYDPPAKPGLANLAEITAAITGRTPEDVLAGVGSYGELKDTCADAVIAELEPIRRHHDALLADRRELRRRLELGAEKAAAVAGPVLRRARAAMGVGPQLASA